MVFILSLFKLHIHGYFKLLKSIVLQVFFIADYDLLYQIFIIRESLIDTSGLTTQLPDNI